VDQNSRNVLAKWCRDIDEWPQSWAGDDEDIVVGNRLVTEFKHYLLALINKGRTKKTVKKHADYLWALGGEIIRDTNENGGTAMLSNTELLSNYINVSGGPYWPHAQSDRDSEEFDSICRGLYKHLGHT